MKSFEQAQSKTIHEADTMGKKYSYLNGQNSDFGYVQSSRPKILETISEEAFSEDKGSISNRSESAQNTNRIRKNLSEQNINTNRTNSGQNHHDQPIHSMSHLIEAVNFNNQLRSEELSGFEKRIPSTHRVNEVYGYSRYECCECPLYLNKIAELQNTYQLLLLAKNQELQECKIIIKGLEQKLKQIEKRSLQQIQKNKKFRSQIQRKNTEDHFHRERENQMIEYLKNRQIVLLEQMKELQNKIYIKDIKTRINHSASKSAESNKRLHFHSKGFSSTSNHVQFNHMPKNNQQIMDYNQERSISQCSAKTFQNQFPINQNGPNDNFQFLSENAKQMTAKNDFYSSAGTRMTVQLIQRVPLTEILKKTNEIQCLKDNLLVSELKIKIQQTKSLENMLLPK